MGENTKISWCDATFNPWIGCTKISAGCANCYALDLMETRYKRVKWGPQGTRQRTGAANWRKPLQWNKQAWEECAECGWRGPHHETHDFCPNCDGEDLRPTRQRVFCASLADVFEDNPQLIEWRADLLALIEKTPNLDWLLLTKRPENVNDMVPAKWRTVGRWPRHVWIGTSVENQETADKRIPQLQRVPAWTRFLSMEPLLGPVDLTGQTVEGVWIDQEYADEDLELQRIVTAEGWDIDWVIVGGESGYAARPMRIEWAQEIKEQCQAAGVAYFFKQVGGHPDKRDKLSDIPENLRIREFPQAVMA